MVRLPQRDSRNRRYADLASSGSKGHGPVSFAPDRCRRASESFFKSVNTIVAPAPHAELFRGADGEGDRLVAAHVVTMVAYLSP